jgi:hypothetical protein
MHSGGHVCVCVQVAIFHVCLEKNGTVEYNGVPCSAGIAHVETFIFNFVIECFKLWMYIAIATDPPPIIFLYTDVSFCMLEFEGC